MKPGPVPVADALGAPTQPVAIMMAKEVKLRISGFMMGESNRKSVAAAKRIFSGQIDDINVTELGK